VGGHARRCPTALQEITALAGSGGAGARTVVSRKSVPAPADQSDMNAATCLAIGILLTVTAACDGGAAAAEKEAVRTFEQFQQALVTGDQGACAHLLTRESQPAVAQMPWERLRHEKPLRILGTTREGFEYWIRVADPNQGDRESCYVVVREYGKLVVDLLATAAHNVTFVPHQGPPDFQPTTLTPAELERVRRMQLDQPH
jgi:hypothetical protein